MAAHTKNQWAIFIGLLLVYATMAFLTYAFFLKEATAGLVDSMPATPLPLWEYGLINGGIVIVVYGFLGLIGFWCARKLGIPWMYREGADWRKLLLQPLWIGVLLGASIIVGDRVIAVFNDGIAFIHPAFPFSIIASASAGIGEEIMFRGFVMAIWALLFFFILRRWNGTRFALWIGNIIGALAFAAGHLPNVMLLLGVTEISAIPIAMLLGVFVLNGILGLIAGERMMKYGLIAAMGIHFWADIVWHVLWPLISLRS
jgi:membrane protease YdiL (CAAX protease family)